MTARPSAPAGPRGIALELHVGGAAARAPVRVLEVACGFVASTPHTRRFEVRGPHDLLRTLRLHRFGPFDPTTHLDADALWRADRLAEGPATLHVRKLGPDEVEARAWGPAAEAMLEAAPGLLGLHDDPTAFAPEHPALKKLHRARRGIRVVRVPDPMRVLVQTILEQRVRWKDAARAFNGLTAEFGAPAPGPRAGLRLMPEPRVLAKLPMWAYSSHGVEQKRARTLVTVCRSHRRIRELPSMPIEDAQARLRAFPGVGPWTAGMVCGYALGHADAAPTGDLDLPHVVSWVLQGKPRSDDDEMLELLEPFRPHRWRVIRLIMESHVHPPRTGPKAKLGPLPGRGRRLG